MVDVPVPAATIGASDHNERPPASLEASATQRSSVNLLRLRARGFFHGATQVELSEVEQGVDKGCEA